jgi:hypothetical protein
MKILLRLLLALLAILGVSAIILSTIPDATTTNVTFTYQRATERADGTPLLLEDIKYTRLYCDGNQVAEEAGANGEISAELTGGLHICYGTHVDTNGLESNPSQTTKKFVDR